VGTDRPAHALLKFAQQPNFVSARQGLGRRNLLQGRWRYWRGQWRDAIALRHGLRSGIRTGQCQPCPPCNGFNGQLIGPLIERDAGMAPYPLPAYLAQTSRLAQQCLP